MAMSVSYQSCICTGDANWLPSECTFANNTLLYIDNIPATVKGALWAPQLDVTKLPLLVYNHFGRYVDQGSSLVWIEGIELSRVGDTITNIPPPGSLPCRLSAIAQGSELVFAD